MKTLPNLRRVIYSKQWWQNQCGMVTFRQPVGNTVNGEQVNHYQLAAHLDDYPAETLLARAQRRRILDVWTFHVAFVFTSGRSLEYHGERGERLFDLYKGIVYNNKRK